MSNEFGFGPQAWVAWSPQPRRLHHLSSGLWTRIRFSPHTTPGVRIEAARWTGRRGQRELVKSSAGSLREMRRS